jgi:hypothetical protein
MPKRRSTHQSTSTGILPKLGKRWKSIRTIPRPVPSEFHEYLDVFYNEKSSRFPNSTSWDHRIELKEGFQPKLFKIYPLTPEEDAMAKEFVDDNLAKNFIHPSKSPMASPFFLVHKKGTAKK